jgi:N-methylhydantoinase B
MSRLNEYISVESDRDERWLRCRCGHRLCGAEENPKEHVKAREFPIQHAGPQVVHGKRELSERFVWREFYCPGCGLMLNTEVALKGEPYLFDAKLH